MGDFLTVFSSKLNLEPTEPLVCPQKPNLKPTEPPKPTELANAPHRGP